ncbi:MAG: YheU family protein [Myxococcota bacterium]
MIRLEADQLTRAALRGLVEEFVTRDGTDYGAVEQSLDAKIAQVERQIAAGEVVIVFDPESESANLALASDLEDDGA